jgi:hypothetical protein
MTRDEAERRRWDFFNSLLDNESETTMVARGLCRVGWTLIVAALAMGWGLTGCGEADDDSGIRDVTESPDHSGDGEVHLTPASENDPHLPDSPGPWFEGWYTRVTDVGGTRSLAVITASHLPKGVTYTPGMDLPGYVNVLISEGDGASTLSFTAFPEQTMTLVNGQPVSKNPVAGAPTYFEWITTGPQAFGTVTEDSVDISIPDVVDVRIQTTNRIPWDVSDPLAGPEAFLTSVPLPLHWYIQSLGSDAEYEYTLYGEGVPETFSGTGYAHLEKNWQKEFPIGWVWMQGIGEGNESQFVASVAKVDLGNDNIIDPWIVGYRSPGLTWNFQFFIPGSVATTVMDPCAGTFYMKLRDPFRTLIFDASAPPDSFGDVSIPTEDGFVPQKGGESFSATVEVSASWHIPLGDLAEVEFPIEQRVFYNTALEYGNEFECR